MLPPKYQSFHRHIKKTKKIYIFKEADINIYLGKRIFFSLKTKTKKKKKRSQQNLFFIAYSNCRYCESNRKTKNDQF